MTTLALRIADTVLCAFWLWVLVQTLRTGRIGGLNSIQQVRTNRPELFWFVVFIFALMVLHFGGLAIVGQNPVG